MNRIDELIRTARELAREGQRLSALEEAGEDVRPGEWETLDDQRATLTYALAELPTSEEVRK